jgi:hypothetical protein
VVFTRPFLYFPLVKFRLRYLKKSDVASRLVDSEKDIVIEGFPRSANTFACFAFIMSQPNIVKIAHHMHAPAQIIRAINMNIPTIVLIRKPDDAILSMIISKQFKIDITSALKLYISFYQSIAKYKEYIVVAKFEEVTQKFDLTIRRVNQKFETNFKEFLYTSENIDNCHKLIYEFSLKRYSSNELMNARMSLPVNERYIVKKELFEKIMHSKQNRELLRTAYFIYRNFVNT